MIINAQLQQALENNAVDIPHPVKREVALEMLWSVRRQRAYQLAMVEAARLLQAKPDLNAKDLLFWINERVELAHSLGENMNV